MISLDRREKRLLLAAVLLAVIVRIAYIAATRGHTADSIGRRNA